MNVHRTNTERLAAISDAYQQALSDAKRGIGRGCYRSRGIELVAADAAGEKLNEGGVFYWDKTGAEFKRDVESLLRRFPQTVEIYAEGGIDYATSVREFEDGSYDPLVEDYAVLVWKKA